MDFLKYTIPKHVANALKFSVDPVVMTNIDLREMVDVIINLQQRNEVTNNYSCEMLLGTCLVFVIGSLHLL